MTCRPPAPARGSGAFLRAYETLWFPAAGAWALAAGARNRRRMRERLGLGLPAAGPPPGGIWIHALSVGEVLSALPLVEALQDDCPQAGLVVTVATAQGMQVASRALGGKVRWLLPMPLDFPRSAARMVDFAQPSLFVLVETDIWPGLPRLLELRGVPSLLVNGRVSPRTFGLYRRFAPLVRRLFDRFSLCLMQTPLDRERLLAVGVSPHRVLTAGNIKFDRRSDPMGSGERAAWQARLGLSPGDRILVAGSTHPGEEALVLEAFRRLGAADRRLRLIIAPRRVETAPGLLQQALAMGLSARMRSAGPRQAPGWGVLVIDTLGELARLYGLADISYVGGSLVPAGGHNLLEPAAFGSPVIFGPHTDNFDEMARSLEAAGGGVIWTGFYASTWEQKAAPGSAPRPWVPMPASGGAG